MTNARSLFEQTAQALSSLYGPQEARSVAFYLLEGSYQLGRMEVMLGKPLPQFKPEQWQQQMARLLAHEPVQYVCGKAWFMGWPFAVAPGVLIPRPETEELVQWVAHEQREKARPHLLDIGTGSGCIAIALAKLLPEAQVHALDVSAQALPQARQNAQALQADVEFFEIDVLEAQQWGHLPAYDAIVSNPPYVTEAERNQMRPNVLAYEPHTALFVPDNSPLLFYEAIGRLALAKLRTGGALYFEINEQFGPQMLALLQGQGFVQAELRPDIHGKPRMVRALRP